MWFRALYPAMEHVIGDVGRLVPGVMLVFVAKMSECHEASEANQDIQKKPCRQRSLHNILKHREMKQRMKTLGIPLPMVLAETFFFGQFSLDSSCG